MTKTIKTYKCSEVQKTCRYSGFICNKIGYYCDYLDKTGKSRGCDPEACTKYEPKGDKPFRRPF